MIILRLGHRQSFGYVPKHSSQTLYPSFGGANIAFRKKCLTEMGGYDPKTKLSEDTEMCIRVFLSPWKMFSIETARNFHRTRYGVVTFLKKWFFHGYYMAHLFARYNARTFEVFLRKREGTTSKFDFLLFDSLCNFSETPFRGIVFLNSFVVMNACFVALLIFHSSLPRGANLLLAGTGAAMATHYMRKDLTYSSDLARLPANFAFRWLWNAAWFIGGLTGGIKKRMLLVNPAI